MHKVIKSVFNTRIHSTEIPGIEFALAIYIHPYANHILSVWIFLATLVKHQHGVYYVPAVQDYQDTVIQHPSVCLPHHPTGEKAMLSQAK